MKMKISDAQKAKRDTRHAQFRALWKQVAAMPELERIQLANKFGLRTVEGHDLSLANTMLVYLQNSTASVMGGFRQWIGQGRAVRKGEHGCMIWVPIGQKSQTQSEPSADQTEPRELDRMRFIIGTVFDITQTDEIQTGSTEINEAIVEHSGELASV